MAMLEADKKNRSDSLNEEIHEMLQNFKATRTFDYEKNKL